MYVCDSLGFYPAGELTLPSSPPVPVARRQELVAQALMPQLLNKAPTGAFAILVKRLQESLSRMEEFEVMLAATAANEGRFFRTRRTLSDKC